jgi:hypothetical protein
VTVLGKGVKDGCKTFRNGSTSSEVSSECRGLFRRRQFLVEEEVNNVLRGILSQFSDGVAAIVDSFIWGDK